MTKNIGQRTKSKSFKKLRYYNDLIQTLRPQSDLLYNIEKMMCHRECRFFRTSRQTAQQMVKQSVTDFKNWLASLREYKSIQKSICKPKMPRYKKSDLTTVIITKPGCCLVSGRYQDVLKLPLQKQRLYFQIFLRILY